MTAALATVAFRVAGHPVTQGSKRARTNGTRAWVVEAGGDRHRLWRHAVNDAARHAFDGQPPIRGAVELAVVFALEKPASYPKRRVTWPTKARSGDIDKLARLVLDACTGICFADDAQVVALRARKEWAGYLGPGVEVEVVALEEQP